jgi:hypothetical protein
MLIGHVSLVPLEAILGITFMQVPHHPVPADLGDD